MMETSYWGAIKQAQKTYLRNLITVSRGDMQVMTAWSGVTRQHLYRLLQQFGLFEEFKATSEAYHDLVPANTYGRESKHTRISRRNREVI